MAKYGLFRRNPDGLMEEVAGERLIISAEELAKRTNDQPGQWREIVNGTGLTAEEQAEWDAINTAKSNANSNASQHNDTDVKNLGVPDLNDIIRALCAEQGWVDENGIIQIPEG